MFDPVDAEYELESRPIFEFKPIARFLPRLALTELAVDPNHDPHAKHMLHEMSHMLTFAQTNFYADFAARTIIEQSPPFKPMHGVLEIVPQLLAQGGERSAKGTAADRDLCEHVQACLNALNHDLDALPYRGGWDNRIVTSFAGRAAGMSGQKLFNRTFIITLIQVAMEQHASNDWGADPRTVLKDTCDKFLAGNRAPSPDDRSLRHLLLRALGLPADSAENTILDDQKLLNRVFSEAPLDRLIDNIFLIPAVARLEFFNYLDQGILTTSFFSKPSADFVLRKGAYIVQRVNEKFKPAFFKAELDRMDEVMIAAVGSRAILPDPDLVQEKRIWSWLEMMKAIHFFRAMLSYFTKLLAGAPFQTKDAVEKINLFNEPDHVASAIYRYLDAIEKNFNVPGIGGMLQHAKLKPGSHPQLGDVFYLSTK